MKKLRQIGTSRIAITALAALLAMSGAAIAASDDGGPRNGQGDNPGRHGGPGAPGAQKYLTYSETHTYRRGVEKVIRTDAGKLTAVDSDSITLTRKDGVEVTTAIDEDTEIHVPGVDDATTDDLTVGRRVIVSGEQGATADIVAVPGRR